MRRPEAAAAMSGRSPRGGERAGPHAEAAGAARDFALALERHATGTAILVLAGELDLYRAPEIEAAMAEAIGPVSDSDRSEYTSGGRPADDNQSPGENVRLLTVDLRSVTFIDSTTLGLLLAASRRQHAQGGELLILVGPHTPMTAFEVTALDRLLAIRRADADPTGSGS
jgi:anti-anti-sigma regulatory factor